MVPQISRTPSILCVVLAHTCGHIPREKEAAVVWTGEEERRTSARHYSTRGTVEMSGYHQ